MIPSKRQLALMPSSDLTRLLGDVIEVSAGLGIEAKAQAEPTVRTLSEWGEIAKGMPSIRVRQTGWSSVDRISLGGIAEGECVLLSGYSGAGKTHFASNLAANMARKGERVLYLALEDGWRLMGERMRQLDPAGVGFDLIDVPDEETVIGDIMGYLGKVSGDYGLIVVDNLFTLPMAGGADSIWNEQAGWVDRFCDLVRGKSCSALVLHHINKSKGMDEPESWQIAGSTRLQNRVAQVWLLSKDKENPMVTRIKTTKSRRGLIEGEPSANLVSTRSGGLLSVVSLAGMSPEQAKKQWDE